MFMLLLALLCTGRWHILMRPTRLLVGGSISSYNSGSVSPAVFSLLPGRPCVFGPYSSHSWHLTLQAFRVMHVGGALCRWRRSL